MAQFIGDYLKSNFRSFHQHEPLTEDDYSMIIRKVQEHFPDAGRSEIVSHIERVFDIAQKKKYQFTAKKTIEAYNMDEAKEIFADSSYNFAANATCRLATGTVPKNSRQVTELAKHILNESNYPVDDIEWLINTAVEATTIDEWYLALEKRHQKKGTKLTDEDIDAYISFQDNQYNLEKEMKWLIKNHVDQEGLNIIEDVLVNTIYEQ